MKNIKPEDFKVTGYVRFSDIPTDLDIKASKKKKEQALEELGVELSKLQDTLYAHNKYGVLVCLQGMDTAGKDSLVREVFKHFNPRGVVVHSFKTPSKQELQYDYLWRHYLALPEKGKYAVFNRTHYENVLVTRVKPQYLLSENMPGIEKVEDVTPDFWERRFEQILNFERHIAQNGIIVFKFFLHLSKEEQRQRLLRRLEEGKHNWKFNPGDLEDRALWDQFQACYEEALNRTSQPHAPWYIIPADDKQTARYIVAKILLEEMSKYTDIQEPELDPEIKADIGLYREKLARKEL
jgi:PPK2 family polyphosphate:nucleotide phosphotransferase